METLATVSSCGGRTPADSILGKGMRRKVDPKTFVFAWLGRCFRWGTLRHHHSTEAPCAITLVENICANAKDAGRRTWRALPSDGVVLVSFPWNLSALPQRKKRSQICVAAFLGDFLWRAPDARFSPKGRRANDGTSGICFTSVRVENVRRGGSYDSTKTFLDLTMPRSAPARTTDIIADGLQTQNPNQFYVFGAFRKQTCRHTKNYFLFFQKCF